MFVTRDQVNAFKKGLFKEKTNNNKKEKQIHKYKKQNCWLPEGKRVETDEIGDKCDSQFEFWEAKGEEA